MRWFEVFFAILPLRLVFRLFLFSDEFVDTVVMPMTALFLGTGNATPEVPAIMFERLCASPTYGMWYKPDRNTVVSNKPSMVVFPNLSEFYETWRKDLISRGVSVRLSTELTEVVQRDNCGVVVRLKPRSPAPAHHNGNDADLVASESQETFDEIVLCCLADKAKEVLGATASWREKKVLGSAKFSDDITITHNDADYMKKHYENFYREDLAVAKTNGVDQTSRLHYAADNFRPMYYIKMYPEDKSKLEMCFDTTNYQSQFPENVPFEQHVFQTIYLNKDRDRHLWTDGEIREDRIIRQDWWHQLCHTYTHYLFVVPWMMFLQARNHTRFAGSWTLVNAHEVAVISGIAAAVDLGAEYPEDLEHDRFSFLWATGLYGSVYKGPGVSTVERQTWREEVRKGASTENLAKGNAPGRSQPTRIRMIPNSLNCESAAAMPSLESVGNIHNRTPTQSDVIVAVGTKLAIRTYREDGAEEALGPWRIVTQVLNEDTSLLQPYIHAIWHRERRTGRAALERELPTYSARKTAIKSRRILLLGKGSEEAKNLSGYLQQYVPTYLSLWPEDGPLLGERMTAP
ncbi:hypothetical protein O1611_g8056 [Lasiodiplodia mahajangana]|uniref:Uncharacterized protein n=1 Tax=Lasiodiplodia mahajangana TaxID=1108764 RepID=A0ACC2JDW5_9PEZI|nr:hypothetical protein O1611_g8056 [Lasiodiplodia mahajangana]